MRSRHFARATAARQWPRRSRYCTESSPTSCKTRPRRNSSRSAKPTRSSKPRCAGSPKRSSFCWPWALKTNRRDLCSCGTTRCCSGWGDPRSRRCCPPRRRLSLLEQHFRGSQPLLLGHSYPQMLLHLLYQSVRQRSEPLILLIGRNGMGSGSHHVLCINNRFLH